MALDSKDKRRAVIGWGDGSLPDPTGAAFDLSDRAQILGMPRLGAATAPPAGNIGDGPLRWTRWGRPFKWLHWLLPAAS